MKAEFTIKNYRCFEDGHPLRFILEDGFTAFVGSNNCGKSSILKFFHEFRIFWSYLTSPTGNIQHLLEGRAVALNFQSVIDQFEIFCDFNDRDILIEIDFDRLNYINSPPNIKSGVFYIKKHDY